MTPEGKVKAKVKKMLKEHNAYQFWPVQTGYGAATLDCIGCHEGIFFAIETKAPGKHMTARQNNTAHAMRQAGAVVFCIGEYIEDYHEFVYSELDALYKWLQRNE